MGCQLAVTDAVEDRAAAGVACLVCGAAGVEEFLDLGETALANNFLTERQLLRPERKFPLRAGFCRDCHHVQLLDRVPPRAMFDNYLYVSAASSTLREHLQSLAATIAERCRLGSADLVVDIGSNDGTLLAGFARSGARTLGVDPAANLAAIARQAGVETVTSYFSEETARRLLGEHGPAAVITATNSFPHIPDLDDYLRGIDALLAPEGSLVIEAHYLGDLLEQTAFDTVYHEHVSYWALGPAERLFARHGFQVVHVRRLPLHHGQLRLWVRRRGVTAAAAAVGELRAAERRTGLDRIETFRRFADRAGALRRELKLVLSGLRAQGLRIAGYGAPAKGNTLLAYLNLGPSILDYIADRSTLKHGRYTPGTHIPVVAAERILEDQPDYVLLLAWNFAEEIMKQLEAYRSRGGRFILPVPRVEIV